MKKNHFFLFLVLFFKINSTNAFDVESFCRQDWSRETCLKSFLLYKCSTYTTLKLPSSFKRAFECKEVISSFVDLLDIEESPRLKGESSSEEVIFKSELLNLIEKKETSDYLITLKKELDQKMISRELFSLWDFSLNYFQQDRKLALSRIAVLFQDVTKKNIIGTQLRFLKTIPHSSIGNLNVKLLEEITGYFSLEALRALNFINVYPMNLKNDLNPTFYHFYIISYVTEKLQTLKLDKHLTFFIPFLFNTQYEFKGFKGWPLSDPTDPLVGGGWKSKEIYSGYIAALLGTRSNDKMMDLKNFQSELKISPFNLIQSLFLSHLE